MEGKRKGDNVPALTAKQWGLIALSRDIVTDAERILEDH
jgi:hypothetical protein